MSAIGEARKHLRTARRWWWLLALGAIVPMLGSYCLVLQWPARYQAKASLVMAHSGPCCPSTPQMATYSRLLRFYADLVAREPITEAVISQLALDETPQQLADRIETAVYAPPLVLQIQVTHTDPETAALIANTLADELIRIKPAPDIEQQQFIEQQLEDLQAKIAEIDDQINVLGASMNELTSGAEIYAAQNRIARLEQAKSDYQSTYAALEVHQQPLPDILSLIEPAATPQKPVSRRIGLIVGFAGLMGLEVTSGVVSLARYWEHRIRGAKDSDQ
jgi:capsular polysaccharide biosynthesis protein